MTARCRGTVQNFLARELRLNATELSAWFDALCAAATAIIAELTPTQKRRRARSISRRSAFRTEPRFDRRGCGHRRSSRHHMLVFYSCAFGFHSKFRQVKSASEVGIIWSCVAKIFNSHYLNLRLATQIKTLYYMWTERCMRSVILHVCRISPVSINLILVTLLYSGNAPARHVSFYL